MWTAPLPAWNQTNGGSDPADIRTAVIQVLNGSTNVIVRWNYTLLPGQGIEFTTFVIDDGISKPDILGYKSRGSPKIRNRNGYQTRFSIDSTNEFSTLTIHTVTERENATFQCQIFTDNRWTYNIRIEVTGKQQMKQTKTDPYKLKLMVHDLHGFLTFFFFQECRKHIQ